MMLKQVILLIALASIQYVRGAKKDYDETCTSGTDTCDKSSQANLQCTGSPSKCTCNANFYMETTGTATSDCTAQLAKGTVCTGSPADECATGTSCKVQGDGSTKKCTDDNKLYGTCSSGTCSPSNMKCGANLACECNDDKYAAANEDNCPNAKLALGGVCTADNMCPTGSTCKADAGGTKTCKSGVAFVQASLFMVVLTTLASFWSRG